MQRRRVSRFPPAFGSIAAGGALGTSLIAFGVDYSFGNVDAIFSDPPLAFSGVTAGGIVDLRAAVDGRIVVLNSLNLGLTDYVSVLAGQSNQGDLLLSVFDSSHNLISSVGNFGPSGLFTMTINLAGEFDIAYFSVSTITGDAFGVQSVTINTPHAAAPVGAVPEPSTYGLMGVAALGAITYLRRRLKR
jgi:hypothetical protein